MKEAAPDIAPDKPDFFVSLRNIRLGPFLLMIIPLIGLLIFTGISVDGGRVTASEAALFRLINGLPNFLYLPMNFFQYSGVLGIPALVAGVSVWRKHYTLAVLLILIMPAKILSQDLIKGVFQRERPKVYIPDAILRGDVQASGLSFVSGHATIVFAIATLVSPFVSKRIRIALWTIAGLCILARVYLGAHLPRDVFGGAITGIIIGLTLLFTHSIASKLRAAGGD